MRTIECHSDAEQSTPRTSPPADVPETAVASIDAPAQDASTRAQSGTVYPASSIDIRGRARVTLAAQRARRVAEEEARRSAQEARRQAMAEANRVRIRQLLVGVLGLDVEHDRVTGYADDSNACRKLGVIAEVTVDGIRFGAEWKNGKVPALHLCVLARCHRDGCAHQDEPVLHEVNGWGDLGAALEAIEDAPEMCVHTNGNCLSEDWD